MISEKLPCWQREDHALPTAVPLRFQQRRPLCIHSEWNLSARKAKKEEVGLEKKVLQTRVSSRLMITLTIWLFIIDYVKLWMLSRFLFSFFAYLLCSLSFIFPIGVRKAHQVYGPGDIHGSSWQSRILNHQQDPWVPSHLRIIFFDLTSYKNFCCSSFWKSIRRYIQNMEETKTPKLPTSH